MEEYEDNIMRIEDELDKFDKYVETLWNNVILKYIKNSEQEILGNLTEYDIRKFYKFMYENSVHYKKLLDTYKILKQN
jgi:phenylacetate-coenzyme A ligase PaaK-like adenylate-forming protein